MFGPDFVENVHHALGLVLMPSSEDEIGNFFTGQPPTASPDDQWGGREKGEEGEREEGEEGEREEVSAPPKAKRTKTEIRALSVSSLHVSQYSCIS